MRREHIWMRIKLVVISMAHSSSTIGLHWDFWQLLITMDFA